MRYGVAAVVAVTWEREKKDCLHADIHTWSVRSAIRGGAASGGVRGDLRSTVRASPPHPSSTLQPVELPKEHAGPSAGRGAPRVSFGAPFDDQMSIAASEGEPSLSRDDDPAALPPSGVVALF